MSPSIHGLRVVSIFAVFTTLVGCASVPSDLGRIDVEAFTAERGLPSLPQDEQTRALVEGLLTTPLSPQTAVHVALLQNPRVRFAYAELGFAAADIYKAGRLSNPGFSVGALDSSEGGTSLTFGLAQSFTDLLTLPSRSRLAEAEFERVKRMAASEIFELAADVEAAYYTLAGARQIAPMRDAVNEAALASAELAQRFFSAGNINRLELALEKAAASETRLARVAAHSDVVAARADLGQLLGVPADAEWALVSGLPMPLDAEDDLEALVALAFASRLDLDAANRNVDRLADSLGVTRTFRWLGAIEIGVEHEREPSGERLTGPTLSLELPIFNQNTDRVTRAESALMAAEAELGALHLAVGRDVQRAYADVFAARERVEEHQQMLIPLRQEIVQRTQEQVNYMLMGVFELLRAKEQEYDAYESYLEAVRDYWLAHVALKRAVGTSLPGEAAVSDIRLDAKAFTTPDDKSAIPSGHEGHRMEEDAEAAPVDHSGHRMDEKTSPAQQMHHHHSQEPPSETADDTATDSVDHHQGHGTRTEAAKPTHQSHDGHDAASAEDSHTHHTMGGDDEDASSTSHDDHRGTNAVPQEPSHTEQPSEPSTTHAHHDHRGRP